MLRVALAEQDETASEEWYADLMYIMPCILAF